MIHSFNTQIAKVCGVREAILLYNIDFWIAKNKANNKHFYKGHYWTYNSSRAFAELFPYLTQKVIENLLAKLVKDGYLNKDNFNEDSFDRTSWYSLTDKYYKLKGDAFTQSSNSIYSNGEKEATKWENHYIDTDEKHTDEKHTDEKQIHVRNEISHDFENQPRELNSSGEQLALFANENPQEFPPIKSKGYTEEFETFWAIYRKHNAKNKSKAYEAYGKALKKGYSYTQLLEALKKQTEIWNIEKRETCYTPHCSTWLNGESYNDDFETIKQQARGGEATSPKDYNSYEGGIESFKNLKGNDSVANINEIPQGIIKDMLRFILHWNEIVKNGGYTNAEIAELARDNIEPIRDNYWNQVTLEQHLLSYGYGTNIYEILRDNGYF